MDSKGCGFSKVALKDQNVLEAAKESVLEWEAKE